MLSCLGICLPLGGLLVFAAVTGAWHARGAGDLMNTKHYNQPEFYGLGLMMLSGRGLVMPVEGADEALAEFMRGDRRKFWLSDLPSDLETRPLNEFEAIRVYLIGVMACVWYFTGPSWDAAYWVAALYFTGAALGLYLVFRLALPRWFAALLSAAVLLSPVYLQSSTQFRDAGKTPWMLLLVWLLGRLILCRHNARGIVLHAAGLGVVTGIGLGFRQDFMLAIPIAAAVLALFADCGERFRPMLRAAGVGVFAATTWVVSIPVPWFDYDGGSEYLHNVMNGLGPEFERELGMTETSYRRVYTSHDLPASIVPDLYRLRTDPDWDGNEVVYDLTSERMYLTESLLTYPADALTRGIGAVTEIVSGRAFGLPPGDGTGRWDLWIRGALLAACGAVLLGLAARSQRAAWGALVVLAYFCGAMCVQFNLRHYYWLGFVPFLTSSAAVAGCLRACLHPKRTFARPKLKTGFRRVLVFTATVAIVAGAPWLAAAGWQRSSVLALADRHDAAATLPLETRVREEDGFALVELARPLKRFDLRQTHYGYAGHYLVAEFENLDAPTWVWLEFDSRTESFRTCSRAAPITLAAGDSETGVRFFFPVLETTSGPASEIWFRFHGLSMSSETYKQFRGLSIVEDPMHGSLRPELAVTEDRDRMLWLQLPGRQSLEEPFADEIYRPQNTFAAVEKFRESVSSQPSETRLGLYRSFGLTSFPDDAELWHDSGLLLAGLGKKLEARLAFWRAIQEDRLYGPAVAGYADTFDADRRREALERVVRRYPSAYAAHFLLGDEALLSGDPADAAVHYERALEAKPGDIASLLQLETARRMSGAPLLKSPL